eukprot:354672-Chlamydomonas_euryale.AAC.2
MVDASCLNMMPTDFKPPLNAAQLHHTTSMLPSNASLVAVAAFPCDPSSLFFSPALLACLSGLWLWQRFHATLCPFVSCLPAVQVVAEGRRAAASLWVAQRRDARMRWRSDLEAALLLVSGLATAGGRGGGDGTQGIGSGAARGDAAEDDDEDGHGDPPEAKQLLQVWGSGADSDTGHVRWLRRWAQALTRGRRCESCPVQRCESCP